MLVIFLFAGMITMFCEVSVVLLEVVADLV
jgi:hypothetical protein